MSGIVDPAHVDTEIQSWCDAAVKQQQSGKVVEDHEKKGRKKVDVKEERKETEEKVEKEMR